MPIKPILEGLRTFETEGEVFYFDEQMVKDNFLIAKTQDHLSNIKTLRLYFKTIGDAGYFEIAVINSFSDDAINQIISNIYALYQVKGKGAFLECLYEEAGSFCTTVDLSNIQEAKRFREAIATKITNVFSHLAS